MKKLFFLAAMTVSIHSIAQNAGVGTANRQSTLDVKSRNDNGMLSVNYNGLIPIMIESIKEQQQLIQKQEQRIERLEKLAEQLLKK